MGGDTIIKFLLGSIGTILGLSLFQPELAGMLGVSTYAAKSIVDAILKGASLWTIISLILCSGGSMAVAFALIKSFIKRFGSKAAISW